VLPLYFTQKQLSINGPTGIDADGGQRVAEMAEGAAHARLDGAERLAESGGDFGLAEPRGVQREHLALGGWELREHTGDLRVAERTPSVGRGSEAGSTTPS